jgi:predicted nucleic acid-binding protein
MNYGRVAAVALAFRCCRSSTPNVSRRWLAAREQIVAEIRNLLAWRPVPIDAAVLENAWKIEERYLLSFWDSLIVSAAKTASCRYLLTEDLQEGQELDGVVVVNPFRGGPSETVE